mmetsp:Transcript_5882/g.15690  ORF Transcript_5882/g.15690 Transcript_5882/m.15690 type:complete len:226 (+) Transcript_5882:326-1003(+)
MLSAPAFKCPPLTNAQEGPRAQRSRAASCMSSTLSIFRPPSKSSASGRFGVTRVAIGKSSDLRLWMASSCRSTWPLVVTMTGSRTKRLRQSSTGPALSLRTSATPTTVSLVPSIPVLMTSAPRSSKTDLICCCTKSTFTGKMPCTPCVFCAVSAAIAVMPNAPKAVQLLRSAWMPAPPPLSEPAMMSTRGGTTAAARSNFSAGAPPVPSITGARNSTTSVSRAFR